MIVSAPEEMPVNETVELADRLREETEVDLAAVVVNRVLPELFSGGDEAIFDTLRDPAEVEQLSELAAGDVRRSSTPPRWPCGSAGRAPSTSPACASASPTGVPVLYVPYLFARTFGARATRQLAEHLGEELGY